MPNQSLVDLTERTATSDSDLIHVNSGGSDYKQTKENFTSDLAKHVTWSTSSTLVSQISALPSGAYYGLIASYGYQTATGMPENANFFVVVQKHNANNVDVVATTRGTSPHVWRLASDNTWIQDPSRAEITALNNSLTPSSTIDAFSIANSNITQLERAYIRKYGKVCVVDLTFTVGTAITDSNAVLFTGLPNGIGNQRFRIPHGYDASKADLALALTTDGKIINQWTSGGIGTGQWQGQFTYIMA